MELYKKEEYYKIVGLCMEVHRILGTGLCEIVYKDALEYGFIKNEIKFEREKEFNIKYKDIFLKHKFYADFIVSDDIVLEIKVAQEITKEQVAQTINYVNLAWSRLGIIVNFKNRSIEHRRIAV